MKTIQEICNSPEILEGLRWDMTAEKLAIPKDAPFNPENAGYYFCIYTRGSEACLALLHYKPDGSVTQECIADFPEGEIREAIAGEQGYDGYYAINKPIEKMLRFEICMAAVQRRGRRT